MIVPLFWQSGCSDRKFKYLHEYVGLWYQSKYSFLLSDIIVISRKLSELFFSTSSVNCNLGLNELKTVSIWSVRLKGHAVIISSTYLK